jgi:hypothetical protein
MDRHFVCREMHWEPIEAWRRYSAHAAAVLRVAERLQKGLPGTVTDWQAILAVEPETEPYIADEDLDWDETVEEEHASGLGIASDRFPHRMFGERGVERDRRYLHLILREWQRRGNVGLHIDWDESESSPTVRLSASGLVGIIATQMIATISSPLYVCAGCQNAFTPPPGSRKPAAGRKAWCPDCGRLAQWREYQKRRYETQKGGAQ